MLLSAWMNDLFNDPLALLKDLAIMLPAVLMALSCHEAAHGYVALKCGDPTAKLSGRVTLNPLKHINPVGFLCMLVVGFGWANPVPVNPRYYKHGRRDDLMVSMAGISANLLLTLISFILMAAMALTAISGLPKYDNYTEWYKSGEAAMFEYDGDTVYLFENGGYIDSAALFDWSDGRSYYQGDDGEELTFANSVIEPALGKVVSVIYQLLSTFAMLNLSLAVFNLLPVPPLDGYHLLNDIVLKRSFFAPRKVARTASIVIIILVLVGNYKPEWNIISIAISWVQDSVFGGLTSLLHLLAQGLGIV